MKDNDDSALPDGIIEDPHSFTAALGTVRPELVERLLRLEALTAAWSPLSSEFLSEKAKAQLRDKNGRWIEMGAMVKFWGSHGRRDQDATIRYGKVIGQRADTGSLEVYESGRDAHKVLVQPENLEVVKAVIPDAKDPIDPQGLNMSPTAATSHYRSDISVGDVIKSAQGPLDVLTIEEDKFSPGTFRIKVRNRRTGKEVPLAPRRTYSVYDHPELLDEQS